MRGQDDAEIQDASDLDTQINGGDVDAVVLDAHSDVDVVLDAHADVDGVLDAHADVDSVLDAHADAEADSGNIIYVHDEASFEVQLYQTLSTVEVRAIGADGRDLGYDIDVIDSTLMDIVDCGVTLSGAPADTVAWVGELPCITLIFSIHAAETEDPVTGDGDWGSCGLLIRGVTLSSGSIEAPADLAVGDIDLIDVVNNGGFEGSSDYATPEDTTIHDQLIEPVNAVKSTLLDLLLSG